MISRLPLLRLRPILDSDYESIVRTSRASMDEHPLQFEMKLYGTLIGICREKRAMDIKFRVLLQH